MEKAKNIEQKEVTYLTRKEVAQLLKISLPTLHSYTKQGLIPCYRIGCTIRYRLCDIQQSFKIRFAKKGGQYV